MDSSGYLTSGILFVIFGIAAILLRKRSAQQNRPVRTLFRRVGMSLPSDRFYEMAVAAGGGVAVATGVGFIVAGLALMSHG